MHATDVQRIERKLDEILAAVRCASCQDAEATIERLRQEHERFVCAVRAESATEVNYVREQLRSLAAVVDRDGGQRQTEDADLDATVARMRVELAWGPEHPTGLPWDVGRAWCEALGDGWRMPTLGELRLAWEDGTARSVHRLGFYWSSSEHSPSHAWCVGFYAGRVCATSKSVRYHVRAVRADRLMEVRRD